MSIHQKLVPGELQIPCRHSFSRAEAATADLLLKLGLRNAEIKHPHVMIHGPSTSTELAIFYKGTKTCCRSICQKLTTL